MRDAVVPAHTLEPGRRENESAVRVSSVQFVQPCVQIAALCVTVKATFHEHQQTQTCLVISTAYPTKTTNTKRHLLVSFSSKF